MSPKAITSKELGPVLGLYSHGMRVAAGEIIVVAGQVGTDAEGKLVGPGDVRAQTRQTFENIRKVLAAAGCTMSDIVRLQTFLTHATDIDGFMQARREVFPRYYADGAYPPNTLLIVSRLVRPELLIEIEAMAVKPGGRARRESPRRATARKPKAPRRRR